jgi:hypothetical protein
MNDFFKGMIAIVDYLFFFGLFFLSFDLLAAYKSSPSSSLSSATAGRARFFLFSWRISSASRFEDSTSSSLSSGGGGVSSSLLYDMVKAPNLVAEKNQQVADDATTPVLSNKSLQIVKELLTKQLGQTLSMFHKAVLHKCYTVD